MPLAAILEALVLALAQQGVAKLFPLIAAKLPADLLGTIVKDAMGSTTVQGWIAKGETVAVAELSKLVGEAVVDVEAFAKKHVAASLLAALETAIPSDFVLHLSVPDIKLFSAAVLAGKWPQVEAIAEQAVGLAPPSP